ncbi:TetR/AcrR family transcriptional regulator [Pseudomonas xanthosomatis]|uniref:TetR/AcrR family transcriptional regulator n=1 Tax=Pseudomonas xanthosomatis TaxID=2842356 RepID=UPI0035157B18
MPQHAHSCRDGLLRVASELMAEIGYAAMSMRQLAARAGLQPGSLYNHVASKQDLLLDVLLYALAQRLEAWRCSTYPRNLQGYLRFMLERQRTHSGEELLLRHESRHVSAQQRGWVQAAQHRLREPLRQYIAFEQHCADDVSAICEAVLALLDSADNLRRREAPMDEPAIERWVMRMSRLLVEPQPVTGVSRRLTSA